MNNELKKELEEIAPSLANIPKEDIQAPEGYFDSFEKRMMAKIKAENIEPENIIPLFPSKRNWSNYIAAAVILFFIGFSIVLYKINQESATNTSINTTASIEDIYLSEIDEESIIEYTNTHSQTNNTSEIELYQSYIDEETIIEQL